MSTNGGYTILIGKYAEEHFISSFSKKYKTARDTTFEAILQFLYRLDNFLLTTKAEVIHKCDEGDIIKCEFSIAGSGISAHASGNRYIIYRAYATKTVTILLVYTKAHIKGAQETTRRRKEIKNNYATIHSLFSSI